MECAGPLSLFPCKRLDSQRFNLPTPVEPRHCFPPNVKWRVHLELRSSSPCSNPNSMELVPSQGRRRQIFTTRIKCRSFGAQCSRSLLHWLRYFLMTKRCSPSFGNQTERARCGAMEEISKGARRVALATTTETSPKFVRRNGSDNECTFTQSAAMTELRANIWSCM